MIKQIHISFWFSIIVAVVTLCPATLHARTVSDTSPPQTREASSAKVSQLLQQAGYSHRKTGDNTWVINRPGGKGPMLVAAGQDFVGGCDRLPRERRADRDLARRGQLRAGCEPPRVDQRHQVIGELARERDVARAVGTEGDLEHAPTLEESNWHRKGRREAATS